MNTLSMVKGEHRWIVRYELGGESAAFDAIASWADRRIGGFASPDALVLCGEIKRRVAIARLIRDMGNSAHLEGSA